MFIFCMCAPLWVDPAIEKWWNPDNSDLKYVSKKQYFKMWGACKDTEKGKYIRITFVPNTGILKNPRTMVQYISNLESK